MKPILLIFFFFTAFSVTSQTTISGKVMDSKNQPIEGANVYLEGTYDGSTTDENGFFSFKTNNVGIQTLKVSFISFETYLLTKDVSVFSDIQIILRDDVNALDTVVISAGTFSAGDNSKISVLKPLDVVTTASAMGDFVGALQTLPGTTTVAEDGRLFVRGGEAEETQIFIDGIRVFTPYAPTANNTPTRGRYSPFLFDGITFSTGGYSAEYGQALSSVLLLNTIEEPDQEKSDIGIMSVGASLGHTEKWKTSSLSVNGAYINLAPYMSLFSDRNDWIEPYQGGSGEAVFRKKFNNGLLKLYSAFEFSNFELIQEDINFPEGVYNKLNNRNLYFNGSYKGILGDNWTVFTGLSYTNNNSKIDVVEDNIKDTENSYHAKFKLNHRFNNRFKLNFGAEYFATNFNEDYDNPMINELSYGFNNNISAAFTEADVFFSKNLAFKAGLRTEYSELFKQFTLSPRISLAYKTSAKSQVSLAYGNFYQNPNNNILKFKQDLNAQKTTHYILNYQLNNNGKILRAEAYYKNYDALIKYDTEYASFSSNYNNSGTAYATGIDLFWRDNVTVKNLDYWISYGFLDSERDYENYPIKATPNFVNTHNLSVVTKYWIENWKSQIGMSYAFASGRTYTNPNTVGFLNQKTKSYNSLSLNWAYLISQQKILYLSVNNVLGIKNINGYQYADVPDSHGNYASRALRPAADQFFFVGFFWTISEKGTDNQLDKL
ncbi:TonB-dependent receptor [Xanthomarina sp. F2636L]|uniref:TonB-dependent receptor n=1 Tax=Xanthomarina sp. F2636L TaxID=2996018 RepID=UPI00225DEF18|nr:TonB-dependent receptor [Xanthomarina sp. F2636L]MCX7550114.1 TonB-dependent receptor [Xanthomarina sp. F2636L]